MKAIRPLLHTPRRPLFNFLRQQKPQETTTVTKTPDQQDLQINQEETRVLWDLYEPKEEEGLDKFQEALSQQLAEF